MKAAQAIRGYKAQRNDLVGLILGCCLALIWYAPATIGHPSSDWYGATWKTGTRDGVTMDKRAEWNFVQGFPTGNKRARTLDGAQEWNQLGQTMTFGFQSTSPDFDTLAWGTCPGISNYQLDKIGWGDFGGAGYAGEPLAATGICTFPSDPSTLHSFKIKVNAAVPWYDGTGTPPSSSWDIWSVMAHEFGHATGRNIGGDGDGHFAESSIYCPAGADSGRHTMCPSVVSGTSQMRTPATHDSDTFGAAY